MKLGRGLERTITPRRKRSVRDYDGDDGCLRDGREEVSKQRIYSRGWPMRWRLGGSYTSLICRQRHPPQQRYIPIQNYFRPVERAPRCGRKLSSGIIRPDHLQRLYGGEAQRLAQWHLHHHGSRSAKLVPSCGTSLVVACRAQPVLLAVC